MQQESQIYESIISNILVAGDVDNSPQKKVLKYEELLIFTTVTSYEVIS